MRREVWSLNRIYEQQKQDSQGLSPAEFRRLFPPPGTPELPEPIDPTQAHYWDLAECSPEERLVRIQWQEQVDASGKDFRHSRDQYAELLGDHFTLTSEERAMLDRQGFVVSDRLATPSFIEQFDRVFRNDLPVFISADSLLHAWAFSFENVLEDIEEVYLRPWLIELLVGTIDQIPQAYDDYGRGPLADSLRDADCFLRVALNLLQSKTEIDLQSYGDVVTPNIAPWTQAQPRRLYRASSLRLEHPTSGKVLHFEEVETRILEQFDGKRTLRQVWDTCKQDVNPGLTFQTITKLLHRLEQERFGNFWPPKQAQLPFFQGDRIAAILQKIARQEVAELLLFGRIRRMNFQCFRPRGRYCASLYQRHYFQAFTWLSVNTLVTHGLPESPAQVRGALVLYDLVQRSGLMEQWTAFDRTLRSLIGATESLGLADVGQVLAELGIASVGHLRDLQDFVRVEAALAASPLGRASYMVSAEMNPDLAQNAQTFSFAPQRFMVDSWALDRGLGRDPDGYPRRYPSCLDVAFAVFGNDAIAPVLADRAAIDLAELTATRGAIDSLTDETYWQQSVVTQWVAMLRELSVPSDDRYPAAMRTTAWASRLGETQLASWTELRHATILYAQPWELNCVCEYPAALVELRPAFWRRFTAMVRGVQICITQLPQPTASLTSDPRLSPGEDADSMSAWIALASLPIEAAKVTENLQMFLDRFMAALQQLGDIAELQLARSPLTPEQTQFLRDVIESEHQYGGMRYTGWYSQLFYEGYPASDETLDAGKEPAALVTDVCAFPKAGRRPAWALHQAIGKVDLLTIVADTGQGLTRFAGPVFSHYEFATAGDRWTDKHWKTLLSEESPPPRPSYTSAYRVPATGQQSSSDISMLGGRSGGTLWDDFDEIDLIFKP
jgi:hypothetical protein